MPKKKKQKKLKNKPIITVKSEKNFSENSGPVSVATISKTKNFPAKGPRKRITTKILLSHRAIFENYKDNGFRNLGKAIRKTGVYSESLAGRVNVLTKSKSWQALMDEKMPEEHLALRHKEILDKRDTRKVVDADGKVSYEDIGPNTLAVTKGLELAYRLRGSFKEKDAPPPSTVMYNLFYKPEVRDQMKNFEEGIRKSLYDEVARKNKRDIQRGESSLSEGDGIRDTEFKEPTEE
jgi:hypothetical protein|tara:strand:+ start:387 stop:1094 length:708 start_codon:yes stop_codon:yes gene_type:complete